MGAAELAQQIRETSKRYHSRAARRAGSLETLRTKGVLHVDTPQRITKRLERLGTDWTLATALEGSAPVISTGRSLPRLSPERFGAAELGLERLMGRNDMLDVGFLEAGYRAARSVGRIRVGGADGHYGTGFLISPSLLLTNNHVLSTADEAGRALVEFNYQAGVDGRALAPVAFELRPGVLFGTDAALDYTVVAVASDGGGGARLADFGWLRLIEAEGKVILGEQVNIIQHPHGEPKQLALRENLLVDLLPDFVHYETDTAPGSSGSPVFNDQWEVIALHHSGVPQTDDQGRWVAVDGRLWTADMGEDRVAWIANEGARISRVLRHLRELSLAGAAARLRDEVFTATAVPVPAEHNGGVPRVGVAEITVPLRITLNVGAPATSDAPAYAVVDEEDDEVRAALVAVEAARDRPYYDQDADSAARLEYYAGVDRTAPANELAALTDLVERTHARRPPYKPTRLLYPWVDLHPDRQLRSIYSGKPFTPEEFIRADARAEAQRARRWQELVRETTPGTAAFTERAAQIEAELAFNCEHVVPQSWFAKAEPMRGDLHHLFACEVRCNSFRSNIPYFDFTEREEVVRQDCGRREDEGFEPAAGKGPVARATLYFLLRYPGLIGDADNELSVDQLSTLLSWHNNDPVTEYELHRNHAIAELQGNRNPFIDDPTLPERIDLTSAWR